MKYLGLNCIQQSVAIFVWAWFNGHMYLMNVNISPLCIFSFGLFKWIGMFEIWHPSLIMSRPLLSINYVQKGLKVSSHIKTVKETLPLNYLTLQNKHYTRVFSHMKWIQNWFMWNSEGKKGKLKIKFLLSFLNFIFISINLHFLISFHSNFLHFYCTYINILTYEFIFITK